MRCAALGTTDARVRFLDGILDPSKPSLPYPYWALAAIDPQGDWADSRSLVLRAPMSTIPASQCRENVAQ